MSGLRWRELTDGVGEVQASDGSPLARYSWLRANHPYFDQIRPLSHRGVLTTHAPHDHRWHHGLWWSWKFVNDVLFWEDHPQYGGNRAGLGRSIVTDHAVEESDGTVLLTDQLAWRVNATEEDLLREHRSVRIAADADGHYWTMDWDQTWSADIPVYLDVTPWPANTWGGYAGLNYRPARSMATDETIVGDGRRGVAALHGEPSAWAAYSGIVDGAESDEPNKPAHGSIALLQHPDNPRYPSPIYCFSAATDFGFLATAPLMREPLQLDRAASLRLRTRVIVLGAAADVDKLAEAHHTYATTSTDDPPGLFSREAPPPQSRNPVERLANDD